jgi:hypothetical protein
LLLFQIRGIPGGATAVGGDQRRLPRHTAGFRFQLQGLSDARVICNVPRRRIFQRKLKWIEISISRQLLIKCWSAGYFYFILKDHHLNSCEKSLPPHEPEFFVLLVQHITAWRYRPLPPSARKINKARKIPRSTIQYTYSVTTIGAATMFLQNGMCYTIFLALHQFFPTLPMT